MDFIYQWLGQNVADDYTRETLSAIALLIVGAIIWFIWKFFYSLLKHVIMGVFVLILGGALYFYFRSSEPVRPPEVGKHAYGVSSGLYLGVVQNVTTEGELGVRKPDGFITKYSRSRVHLKDKMDAVEPLPSPTASPTPLQNARPRVPRAGKKGVQ